MLWATHLIDEIGLATGWCCCIAAGCAPPAPSPRWSLAAGGGDLGDGLPAAHRTAWPPEARRRQARSLRRRISPNTSASRRPPSPGGCRKAGSAARRNGLVAFSTPIVVGMVGAPRCAGGLDLLCPPRQRRVVRVDAQREARVAQRVLVAAIDPGGVGQGHQLAERAPHGRRRRPRTAGRSRARTACRRRTAPRRPGTSS